MGKAYDINELLAAARTGGEEGVLEHLNDRDAAKIKGVLNDPALLRSMLESDAAKQLMRRLARRESNP